MPFIEIIVCLCISAFKSKDEDFNHEFEYERRFGNVEYIDHKPDLIETSKDKKEKVLKHSNKKNKDEDILINIEDEKPVYEADDEEDLMRIFFARLLRQRYIKRYRYNRRSRGRSRL